MVLVLAGKFGAQDTSITHYHDHTIHALHATFPPPLSQTVVCEIGFSTLD